MLISKKNNNNNNFFYKDSESSVKCEPSQLYSVYQTVAETHCEALTCVSHQREISHSMVSEST